MSKSIESYAEIFHKATSLRKDAFGPVTEVGQLKNLLAGNASVGVLSLVDNGSVYDLTVWENEASRTLAVLKHLADRLNKPVRLSFIPNNAVKQYQTISPPAAKTS